MILCKLIPIEFDSLKEVSKAEGIHKTKKELLRIRGEVNSIRTNHVFYASFSHIIDVIRVANSNVYRRMSNISIPLKRVNMKRFLPHTP